MLTILAMALMKTTRLEEKMAGATRDLNLSFQAAETALRRAEKCIESQTAESYFATTENGIYSRADTEPDDLFADVWVDAYSREMCDDDEVEKLQGVSSSPRYMIKKLTRIEGKNLTITGYADTPPYPLSFALRLAAVAAPTTGPHCYAVIMPRVFNRNAIANKIGASCTFS